MKNYRKNAYTRVISCVFMLLVIMSMLGMSFNDVKADTNRVKIHYDYVNENDLSNEEKKLIKTDFKELKAKKDANYYIVYKDNVSSFFQYKGIVWRLFLLTVFILSLRSLRKSRKKSSSLMIAFTMVCNCMFFKNTYAIDRDKIEKMEDKIVEIESSLPDPNLDRNKDFVGYINYDSESLNTENSSRNIDTKPENKDDNSENILDKSKNVENSKEKSDNKSKELSSNGVAKSVNKKRVYRVNRQVKPRYSKKVNNKSVANIIPNNSTKDNVAETKQSETIQNNNVQNSEHSNTELNIPSGNVNNVQNANNENNTLVSITNNTNQDTKKPTNEVDNKEQVNDDKPTVPQNTQEKDSINSKVDDVENGTENSSNNNSDGDSTNNNADNNDKSEANDTGLNNKKDEENIKDQSSNIEKDKLDKDDESDGNSNSSDSTETPEETNDKSKPSENDSKNDVKEDEKSEIEKNDQNKINENWSTYIDKTGKERRILWASGITPPRMGESGDFKKLPYQGYEDYIAKFTPNNGWYDANKSSVENVLIDRSLCFGGVASNMIYWWMDQNRYEINEYIEYLKKAGRVKDEDSEETQDIRYYTKEDYRQQGSNVYRMFVKYFSHKTQGFQTDLLIDFFINGFTPKENGGTNTDFDEFKLDKRAGFFNDIFSNNKLTTRTYGIGGKDGFSRYVKSAFERKEMIGLQHSAPSGSHIVTMWGAEFDDNDKITAVYVTDTDDQEDEDKLGMKRYLVNDFRNTVRITTKETNDTGSRVEAIQTLGLGKLQWKVFFENIR